MVKDIWHPIYKIRLSWRELYDDGTCIDRDNVLQKGNWKTLEKAEEAARKLLETDPTKNRAEIMHRLEYEYLGSVTDSIVKAPGLVQREEELSATWT